jgi:hypothetical protein
MARKAIYKKEVVELLELLHSKEEEEELVTLMQIFVVRKINKELLAMSRQYRGTSRKAKKCN